MPMEDARSIMQQPSTTRTPCVDAQRRRQRSRLVLLPLTVLALFGSNIHDGPLLQVRAFSLRGPVSTRSSSLLQTRGGFEIVPKSRRNNRCHNNSSSHLLSAASLTSDGEKDNTTEATNTSLQTDDKNDDASSPSSPKSYHWTSKTAALALPALIGMLVDPLLSMMDTAYVGNLGSSIELAALGACTSIFHLAFNAFRATTAATTSLVGNASTKREKRAIVKISLSLGFAMGLGVAFFLRVFGPWCLATMGIGGPASPLYTPALSYLSTRSLAAPAVLSVVVAEGAFRGYGNTRIPLLASGVAALVNLVLDPILMLPPISRGVQGAASATAAAQVGALGVYLWFLRRRKMLPQKDEEDTNNKNDSKTSKMGVIGAILGANLAMICKQGSLLLAWAYATAKATRIGAAHVAAHQVALSCWLVFALLQDGAGVASQVLLTKVLNPGRNSDNDGDAEDTTTTKTTQAAAASESHDQLKSLVKYMLRFALLQGLVVTCGFLLLAPFLPGWFVPDDPIVGGHLARLLPHVAGQQLLVSFTLVTESLAVGGKQFRLLAIGTLLSTILSVSQIRGATTVVGVWSRGIVGLFVGRLITACIGTLRVVRQSRKESAAAAAGTPL